MLKALIFDFDGLILDTETPEVEVWQSIYREHGIELPVYEWVKTIGGYGLSSFDAAAHLAELTGLDPAPLRARYRAESDAIINANSIMPGVVDMIRAARDRRLGLAVASSSPHSWVDPHLARLRLADYFDHVICADDVPPGRTKPNPDLFLVALARLKVRNDAAVVFEDSPNGVRAARAAGIFVVAVPNTLTSQMTFEGESLRVWSLADLKLEDLSARFSDTIGMETR